MARKRARETEFKGALSFKSKDRSGSRFNVAMHEQVTNLHTINFVPGVLPADYEPGKYEVSGEIIIKVSVRKK